MDIKLVMDTLKMAIYKRGQKVNKIKLPYAFVIINSRKKLFSGK